MKALAINIKIDGSGLPVKRSGPEAESTLSINDVEGG